MKISTPAASNSNIEDRYINRVRCPWCRSTNSRLRSLFGGTVSEILFQCQDCRSPFGVMKWDTLGAQNLQSEQREGGLGNGDS